MTRPKDSLITPMFHAARRLVDCGLSVIPIKPDGSKSPMLGAWKQYQEKRPTDWELRSWFSGGAGIAVINGAISGNLETLDFDEVGLLDEYLGVCAEQGLGDIVDILPIVATPSGGYHVYFRSDAPPPGNLKLASKSGPDGKRGAVRIETRGEGGYALIPPSPASCHSDGKPYEYLNASIDIGLVPTIPAGTRAALISIAQSFNEWVEPEKTVSDPRPRAAADGLRPGDDYNARGEWSDLLGRHGWTPRGFRGDKTVWSRPGKAHGISATENYGGSGLLYVFSGNAAPFEADHAYSLFSAYALLEHGGDWGAAARELGQKGYGEPPKRPMPIALSPRSDDEAPPQRTFDKRCTDFGNARRLIDRHGKDLRYSHIWGRWVVWDGRRWAEDDSGQISRRAFETVANIYREAAEEPDEDRRKLIASWALKSESSQKLAAMVKIAQDQIEMPMRVQSLDADPFLLTCRNGTLDLRTGELLPHCRAHLISKMAPVDYDVTAACPQWDAFLFRVLGGDAALLEFVQRAVGYSLTGDTRRHGFFILHGKGRNGKSTFIETVRRMMGEYSLETPAESLMAKKGDSSANNDIARLRGARFVSAGESEEGQRLAENLIKRLSGGDTMTARFLHQEFFEFKPQFKLFLATNHKPVIRGTDEGIWRRVNLIPFEVQIPIADVDETLGEKLQSELPGILAWAVRGCQSWLAKGLEQPEIVQQATADYRTEMDTLGAFLEQKCYQSPNVSISTTTLYQEYVKWCEEWGEHQLTMTSFGRRLSDRGLKGVKKPGGIMYRSGVALIANI